MEGSAGLLLAAILFVAGTPTGYGQTNDQEPYLVFPGGKGPFIPHKPPPKDGISPNASAGFIAGFSVVFCILLLLTSAVIKLFADVSKLRAHIEAQKALEDNRLMVGGAKY